MANFIVNYRCCIIHYCTDGNNDFNYLYNKAMQGIPKPDQSILKPLIIYLPAECYIIKISRQLSNNHYQRLHSTIKRAFYFKLETHIISADHKIYLS